MGDIASIQRLNTNSKEVARKTKTEILRQAESQDLSPFLTAERDEYVVCVCVCVCV